MRLAVCAEMVFTDLPFDERVRRIHDAGFDVEMWDSRGKDLAALKATGAVFSSMTGYTSGSLVDPDTADDVVRTAESLIPTALELGVSRMVVHSAELTDGQAARPAYRSTGRMWSTGARTLERLGVLGEKHGVTRSAWKTSTRSWTTPAFRSPAPRTPWRSWRQPGIPT